MNSVSLVLYIIRVRNCNDYKYYSLDNIEGKSFLQLFNDYCNDRSKIYCHSYVSKAICVNELNIINNEFNGWSEIGDYGYSSKIKSIATGQVTHMKADDEAEMLRMFFSGIIPSGAYKGLIALEKFKTIGFKTILQDDFNAYLQQNQINAKVDLYPILPRKVAEQYLQKGRICKIRMIKHNSPKILDTYYEDNVNENDIGTLEYVIKPKKSSLSYVTSKLKKYFNNEVKVNQIIEMQHIEYDNMKLEVSIGKKIRTINLNDLSTLTGEINISNEVELDLDGHPNHLSILNIAKDIINEYIETIDYNSYFLEHKAKQQSEKLGKIEDIKHEHERAIDEKPLSAH